MSILQTAGDIITHDHTKTSRSLRVVEKQLANDLNVIVTEIRMNIDPLQPWYDISQYIKPKYGQQIYDLIRAATQEAYILGNQYVTSLKVFDNLPSYLTQTDLMTIESLAQTYYEKFWGRVVISVSRRADKAFGIIERMSEPPDTFLNPNFIVTSISTTLTTHALNIATLAKMRRLVLVSLNRNIRQGATIQDSQVMWVTSNDERVCFPEYTSVKTDKGDKLIKDIEVGDMILTRTGYKRCKATSKRPYQGQMNILRTSKGFLVATKEHPIWISGYGWECISNINTNDTLKSSTNENVKVFSNSDFFLSDSNNPPIMPGEVAVLPTVSGTISVPISSIYLDSNQIFRNTEINGISPNSHLLNERDSNPSQGFSNFLFNGSLTPRPTITGEGTIEFITSKFGLNPEFHGTGLTIPKDRRSSTLFGTESSCTSPIVSECLTTPSTFNIVSNRKSTFDTANLVSTFFTPINNKILSTYRTGLSYLSRLNPTLLRTISSILPKFTWSPTNNLTTSNTWNIFSWSKMRTVVYPFQLLTIIQLLYNRIYNKPIYVYDLEIEDQHEFYANDILVHNCPICRPLHGKKWSLGDDTIPIPPQQSHQRCRCRLVVIVPK